MANNSFSETNLIVNYLPQSMTDAEFSELFGRYGELLTARIVKDHVTGYSFGYGFVNYATKEEALTAIESLNGIQIGSKKLKVSFARPPGEALKDTNLYVTNLPRNFSEMDLEELFTPYGRIVQKKLLFDKTTGMPRGVAFVRFDTKKEATSALQALNGQTLGDNLEPLTIKVAEEHGKQKAAYYAGMRFGMRVRGGGGRGDWRGGGRGDGRGGRGHPRFNPMGQPRAMFPPNAFF